MTFDPRLRSPKERPLFVIALFLSGIAWLVLLVSIVGALYGLVGLAFVLMAHALLLAHVRGNGVRVSENQLPDLHARCREIASKLGLTQVPEVYLLQSNGLLNAFATKLLSRRYVVLLSSLVEGCEDPGQLDFVIGHEMAHLAAGHLSWNAVLLPFRLVPWLGPAYSRACEYTCDRAGLAVCGGLEPAARGLVVLAAGGKTAAQVNLDAFMAQRAETGAFWMAILELSSSHPFLCKRVAALQEFVRPGSVPEVGRNPLAYPFSPIFAIAAGPTGGAGAMGLVVMIGILAAIAVPNFIKFQERAKQKAAQQLRHQMLQMQQDQEPDEPSEDGQQAVPARHQQPAR